MKETPILMSAPMVRALIKGTKTQTRRVAKLTAGGRVKAKGSHKNWHPEDPNAKLASPYGVEGDRLWVKETHRHPSKEHPRVRVEYRADMSSWGICDSLNPVTGENIIDAKVFPGKANEFSKQHWRPSIFMHRWASRLLLEIGTLRIELLNKITAEDAIAEGIERISSVGPMRAFGWKDYSGGEGFFDPIESYRSLWESINGPGSWAKNPWVWVLGNLKQVTHEK